VNDRVLVLGGGQLGLMLAEAGASLGIVVDRLDPDTGKVLPGTSDLPVTLGDREILSRYQIITTEREHLPRHGLVGQLLTSSRCAARQAMAILPDRLAQKRLLQRLQIPSAPWCPLAEMDNGLRQWEDIVVKSRFGGYDGRGTWHVRAGSELPDLPNDAIVEMHIPFLRELSLIAARGAGGEMEFYPLVENHHQHGILRLTHAPAQQVFHTHQRLANMFATKLMDALDYRGVMVLELFDCGEELLVNEVAPRIHNSGHWTQEGANPSQFEMHLRALTGLPLTTPQIPGSSAMVNLIGVELRADWLQRPGRLHWYNKAVRPGRKQGHVNLTGVDVDSIRHQLQHWEDMVPGISQ